MVEQFSTILGAGCVEFRNGKDALAFITRLVAPFHRATFFVCLLRCISCLIAALFSRCSSTSGKAPIVVEVRDLPFHVFSMRA